MISKEKARKILMNSNEDFSEKELEILLEHLKKIAKVAIKDFKNNPQKFCKFPSEFDFGDFVVRFQIEWKCGRTIPFVNFHIEDSRFHRRVCQNQTFCFFLRFCFTQFWTDLIDHGISYFQFICLIHPAVTISSHMKPNQIIFQILLYYVIGFSLSCHKNHTCYGQKQNPFDHVFFTHIQRMSCFFLFIHNLFLIV